MQASRGSEFQKRGATTEKALLLLPTNFASLIEGPVSSASLAQHSAQGG